MPSPSLIFVVLLHLFVVERLAQDRLTGAEQRRRCQVILQDHCRQDTGGSNGERHLHTHVQSSLPAFCRAHHVYVRHQSPQTMVREFQCCPEFEEA